MEFKKIRTNLPGQDPDPAEVAEVTEVRIPRYAWWLLGVVLAGMIVVVSYVYRDQDKVSTVPPKVVDEVKDSLDAAEAVAKAFLAEPDPVKRLAWVRNAKEVETRMEKYPEEALRGMGVIDQIHGHQVDGDRVLSGFVVKFPTGDFRFLEVVGTPEGPRVDWDAYAHYSSESWDDLWSGKARSAVVRVFCSPETVHPEPFDDREKWTGFRLSGPGMPEDALGFAEVGSVREQGMKQVLLGTPGYRQRLTLDVVRHEGKERPLFEIARCKAVGWILEETDVEDVWAEK